MASLGNPNGEKGLLSPLRVVAPRDGRGNCLPMPSGPDIWTFFGQYSCQFCRVSIVCTVYTFFQCILSFKFLVSRVKFNFHVSSSYFLWIRLRPNFWMRNPQTHQQTLIPLTGVPQQLLRRPVPKNSFFWDWSKKHHSQKTSFSRYY